MSIEGVRLGDLRRAGIGSAIIGDASVQVGGVHHDSRRIRQGDLFAAILGESHDGAVFAQSAKESGACAMLCASEQEIALPQLLCDDVRTSLGRAAEMVYGHPTQGLRVTGITGTNGKTTTAYLLDQILERTDAKTAMMGTVVNRIGDHEQEAIHTTPEADDISRFARRALDEGTSELIMEISSHGLAMHRVDAIGFSVAAFTNLSQDHLDFHQTMRKYGESKAQLFLKSGVQISVINVDDTFGKQLALRLPGRVIRCSAAGGDADLCADNVVLSREGIVAQLRFDGRNAELRSDILGRHNLENLLVAIGCAIALDVDFERAAELAQHARAAPGRLEQIDGLPGVSVLVDYAHTPDAIERVLGALSPSTQGRVIVVFGAGGDRDAKKRSPMGRAAAAGANLCIVTSDNPRNEDPQAIIDQVEDGLREVGLTRVSIDELGRARSGYLSFVDRAKAIDAALSAAQPGDTVLIAGKGHEAYQIVGSERLPFDDREHAKRMIASLEGRS